LLGVCRSASDPHLLCRCVVLSRASTCLTARVPDRRASRRAVIDNLVKGASGQAIQNLNVMLGVPETTGLLQQALFP
jgi:N-acetyl-gamma-glutamylphosphate reductase